MSFASLVAHFIVLSILGAEALATYIGSLESHRLKLDLNTSDTACVELQALGLPLPYYHLELLVRFKVHYIKLLAHFYEPR